MESPLPNPPPKSGEASNDQAPTAQHWLFWDGDCGFCRRSVAWCKRQDRNDVLEPVPYQEAPFPPMTDAIFAGCPTAVHVLTADGEVLKAGQAALFVLREIGYRRTAAIGSLRLFLPLVELAYAFVARNRYWLSKVLFTRE